MAALLSFRCSPAIYGVLSLLLAKDWLHVRTIFEIVFGTKINLFGIKNIHRIYTTLLFTFSSREVFRCFVIH